MLVKSMVALGLFFAFSSCGVRANVPDSPLPVPRPIQEAIRLGDNVVTLQVTRRGAGPVFLALHENESTSIMAAQETISSGGGTLIVLRHSGRRNVRFTHGGAAYEVDPNRIFTTEGIRRTLGVSTPSDVFDMVRGLADAILSAVSGGSIISLHNNTNGSYSVESYLPGGQYARDAQAVHQSPGVDPDNFFLTTDTTLFVAAQLSGFNAVLQSPTPSNDGSLSVFSAARGMRYVNVEAQHGDLQEQIRMLRWLQQNW